MEKPFKNLIGLAFQPRNNNLGRSVAYAFNPISRLSSSAP
jgi:hypothetical protein